MAIIIILLLTTALAFFVFAFQNFRGVKVRGRRRNVRNQRKSDKRHLSRNEKRLYRESTRLLAQKKVTAAARILEQIHMHREAIQALEDAGQIHEAAKVLMRMQKHNRAGVIYARHGMWEKAAECFKMAKMWVEVGKCAREAGNHGMAAEYFEKSGRHGDAAGCYEKQMDYQAAAKNFLKAGNEEDAVKNYRKLIKVKENLNNVTFANEEIEFFHRHLTSGEVTPEIADYVIFKGQAKLLIQNLAAEGKSEIAAKVFSRVRGNLGLNLIAGMSLQEEETNFYLDLFERSDRQALKGMVYEKLQKFQQAAEAFARAKDYDRAIYCYERAGDKKKAQDLKEQYSQSSVKTEDVAGPFAIGDASHQSGAGISSDNFASTEPFAGQIAKSEEEHTQVAALPNESKTRPKPPPPPQFEVLPKNEEAPPVELAIDKEAKVSSPPPIPAPDHQESKDVETRFSLKAHHTDTENNSLPEANGDAPPSEVQPKVEPGLMANFAAAKFMEDLNEEQRLKLWRIGRTYLFSRSEDLLSYDVEPTGVYIILGGSVNCFRMEGSKEQFVDRKEPGETFGELWLLAGHPTSVRFSAASDVQVHIIDREEFNVLLDTEGTIARKIYKKFTHRLLRRLLSTENNRDTRQAS